MLWFGLKLSEARKGPDDRLVRVYSYGEVFTLRDVLRLLQILFESEDNIYPINDGYQGRAMLVKAIVDLALGIPLERVLKTYRLERKHVKGDSCKTVGAT